MGMGAVNPALLHAWLAGRSLARGLPAPVADHGGFRVDTRSDTETCRWVFAAPSPGITALARTIEGPGQLIKLCGTKDALRALLPGAWELHPCGYFLQAGEWPAATRVAEGYRCSIATGGPVAHVTIRDATGALAASGFAAGTADAYVYDRIVTAPEHRRKGLAGAVMAALRAARTDTHQPELLVATEAGRHLYERLGWRLLSPYATASRPETSGDGSAAVRSG